MKDLIKISREETGFFSDIFVCNNKGKLIKSKVYAKGIFEYQDYSGWAYVLYFKDIETGKLLKFSVEADAKFLGKITKHANTYLIKQMEDFTSLHYLDISEYYEGDIGIEELIKTLKVKTLPVPEIISKDGFVDETFMFYENLLGEATLIQEIKACKYVFQVLFCKCILWYSAKDAVTYWHNLITKNLMKLSHIIFSTCKWGKKYSNKDEELFNLFFELDDGVNTLAEQCDILCIGFDVDFLEEIDVLVAKLGRPFVIKNQDSLIDLKIFEKNYNDFKTNFYSWYFDNYKICKLECYENKISEEQFDEKDSNLQKELFCIVKQISDIKA